jgi:DDE family transposase
MQPLLWTIRSLRNLANELANLGHKVCPTVVGDLLHSMGYSLQANSKTREGGQHIDRDGQFHYINTQAKAFLAANEPVISVDTKKKELVGNFKNNGREWRRNGTPELVNVHDFIDPKLSRAVPYGVYDVTNNVGWVSVGTDHDTAAFAVNAIRRWWRTMGKKRHPKAKRLMITADGGGSNGYRVRLWKVELQKLADELKLPITVCHLPPGTSKWNKIEHRLFSFITINWRGKPLRSYRTIVQLIAATTTDAGLKVRAELDENKYPKGIKVSDLQMAAVNLTRHSFHGDWNYTVSPKRKIVAKLELTELFMDKPLGKSWLSKGSYSLASSTMRSFEERSLGDMRMTNSAASRAIILAILPGKHSLPRDENPIRNNGADVAELVDARDLKFSALFESRSFFGKRALQSR